MVEEADQDLRLSLPTTQLPVKVIAGLIILAITIVQERRSERALEALLRTHALGDHRPPYACDAIAYRLTAPAADHYFLINDGPARAARLDTKAQRYARMPDAVTGESLDAAAPIPLEPYSGRWLRLEKSG